MKRITIVLFLSFISTFSFAQDIDYNVEGGYIADGYDVVAYFSGKATKGKQKYMTTHDKVKYRFSTQENLDKFKANPTKYIPQYGGWCAYAMGLKGEKVSINPKTYEIRDGKLYLFYNALFTNTFDSWIKEGPEKLRKQADENWERSKKKK